MTLNLIPNRVAFVDTNGFLTLEALRFFSDLYDHIGGDGGLTAADIAVLTAFSSPPDIQTDPEPAEPDPWALVAELSKRVEALESVIVQAGLQVTETAELQKTLMAQAIELAFAPPGTDWEHPGKIGAKTANTGNFTIINGTTITGTALNITGATAPVITTSLTGTVEGSNTTFSLTSAAGGRDCHIKLGDGVNASVRLGYLSGNYYEFVNGAVAVSVNGSGLAAVNGFGCNGKTPQGKYVLPAAATDPATTQTLANALRSALIANGIGG